MDLRRWLALGRLAPEATFAKHIGDAERALCRAQRISTGPGRNQESLSRSKTARRGLPRNVSSPKRKARLNAPFRHSIRCAIKIDPPKVSPKSKIRRTRRSGDPGMTCRKRSAEGCAAGIAQMSFPLDSGPA